MSKLFSFTDFVVGVTFLKVIIQKSSKNTRVIQKNHKEIQKLSPRNPIFFRNPKTNMLKNPIFFVDKSKTNCSEIKKIVVK